MLEEVKPLLQDHWGEVALNKNKLALDPDWSAYEHLEAQGQLKIFTAREEGTLVGYFVSFVYPSLHYKNRLFSSNDLTYLVPSHRKGFTGVNLIKFAESCLREDGVSVMMVSTATQKPFHKLMKYLRFSNSETLYSKYIGD